LITLVIVAALVGAGCSSLAPDPSSELLTPLEDLSEVDLRPGEKLTIVATTSILGDVLTNIVEDRAELLTLLPVGADPHAYQPTPQDLTLIVDADVVFISGLGLETFIEKILINIEGQAVVVSLSEDVEAREFQPHDEEPNEGHDDDHNGVDAHVWLDPMNVIRWVANAERALSTLDPANAAGYSSSADAYRDSLDELHRWIVERVSRIPEVDRKLVTDHLAAGYFADRYGFEIIGAVIPAYSTAAEVSAHQLAALQQAIEESGAMAIFVAVGTNPAVSERLAEDLGLRVVQLYIGALSTTGGPAETYIDLMHYNVDAIVNALQP
jgi:ABC-type Zn uptake system ZnuABC Zn-binding protein ZnuA